MASTYKAHILSTSKDGRKAQIQVLLDKKSITRHVHLTRTPKGLLGVGAHPNDKIPHEHEAVKTGLSRLLNEVEEVKAKILVTEALLFNPNADSKVKSREAKFLTPMRAFILSAHDQESMLNQRLAILRKEDPVQVTYFLSDSE